MKRNFWSLLILSTIFMTGCTSYTIIYEVAAPEMKLYDNNYFVNETKDLTLHYDFWSEGGIPLVDIINVSEDSLEIDFRKSYFTMLDQSFSFAGKEWPATMDQFLDDAAFNAMYAQMPQKAVIPKDSVFTFQSIPFKFDQDKNFEDGAQERYLYTNTLSKINHHYVYQKKGDSTTLDTVSIQFYIINAQSIESSQFKNFTLGQPIIANRFYLHSVSPFSYDDRNMLSQVMARLFRG